MSKVNLASIRRCQIENTPTVGVDEEMVFYQCPKCGYTGEDSNVNVIIETCAFKPLNDLLKVHSNDINNLELSGALAP